jgi:hypothetical protein
MFATCMVFQAIYLACIALWFVAPDLLGHSMLVDFLPGFKFLSAGSFIYGLILAGLYGWFVSVVFVFFYNLWPRVSSIFSSDGRAQVAR